MEKKLRKFLESCLSNPRNIETYKFESTLKEFKNNQITKILNSLGCSINHIMGGWDEENIRFSYKGKSFTCYLETFDDGFFEIKPYLL